MRLQSQGGQDLCAAAAAEHLIFKTSTEEQTVDLTNKGMPKDSQRFSRWFHSAWRTSDRKHSSNSESFSDMSEKEKKRKGDNQRLFEVSGPTQTFSMTSCRCGIKREQGTSDARKCARGLYGQYQPPVFFGSTCTRCGYDKKDHYHSSNGKKYCLYEYLSGLPFWSCCNCSKTEDLTQSDYAEYACSHCKALSLLGRRVDPRKNRGTGQQQHVHAHAVRRQEAEAEPVLAARDAPAGARCAAGAPRRRAGAAGVHDAGAPVRAQRAAEAAGGAPHPGCSMLFKPCNLQPTVGDCKQKPSSSMLFKPCNLQPTDVGAAAAGSAAAAAAADAEEAEAKQSLVGDEAKKKAEEEAKKKEEEAEARAKEKAAADAKVVILANISQFVCVFSKSAVWFWGMEIIEVETILKFFPVSLSKMETNLLDRKCQLSFIEGRQFAIVGNTLLAK